MPVKVIYICDQCGREEECSEVKMTRWGTWTAIPNKDWNGWDDNPNERGFIACDHQWLCSDECRSLWIAAAPLKRAIYEFQGWERDQLLPIPIHVTKRTETYIQVSLGKTRFRLSDGAYSEEGRRDAWRRGGARIRDLDRFKKSK